MGSYFKNWSSVNYQYQMIGSAYDNRQPMFGQVLDTLYEGDADTIGRIRVRLHGQDRGKKDEEINTYALPANRNVVKYPVPGEIVLLQTNLSYYQVGGIVSYGLYYTNVVSTTSNLTYNSNPYYFESLNREFTLLTAQAAYQKQFEKRLINPQSIISRGTILQRQSLQPFEGDFLIQDRWGSSIRMGSTGFKDKNQWSEKPNESGNPITIISVSRKKSEVSQTVVEDVNKTDATIYLCSKQTIPITLSSSKNIKSLRYLYNINA